MSGAGASLHGRARLALRLAALAPVFLLGLPAQALANRFSPRLARRLPPPFHRAVAAILGLRVTVAGRPPEGAALVVSNHVSWLDIVVLSSVLPVSFVAKSDVAGWPFFGWLARLQNTVFVDRQRRSATGQAAGAMAARLAAGDALVLFAEGTTSDGARVLPFRSALIGAAWAEGEAIAVQPVAIAYTHRAGLPLTGRDRPEIAWYGDMELLPHLAAALKGGPVDVTVTFCAPLTLGAGADRKRVTETAEAAVRRAMAGARTGRSPAPEA